MFRRAATDRAGDLDFGEFLAAIRKTFKISDATVSKKMMRKLFDYVDVEDAGLVNVGTYVHVRKYVRRRGTHGK